MNITFSDRFPSMELTGKKDGGRPTVTLLENLFVYEGDKVHLIPKFFTSDGASSPLGSWNLFNPLDPDYFPEAVWHDWNYRAEIYSREKCDQLLYEALLSAKIVSDQKAWFMWFIVRSCGWNAWRKHTKKSVLDVRKLAGIYRDERPLFL
jgi:hypothetical protein